MNDRPKIDRFIGDFAFLSNFHPSTIYINGERYVTVEHAYQAAKTSDVEEQRLIREASSPGIAKKLGKSVSMIERWNDIKIDVMRNLLEKKFENPFLRPLLDATDDAELIEGNLWNDKFWGVCRGQGENWLGKLLEERREINRKHDIQESATPPSKEV